MRTPYSTFLLAACTFLSGAATLHARTIDLPPDAPELRLEVPDHWEPVSSSARSASFSKLTWSFAISPASALDSREAAAARLQELTGRFTEGESEPGKIVERRNGQGVVIYSLDATRNGRLRMQNHVIVVPPSSYWLVETLGSVEFDAAEFEAAVKALDSVTPAGAAGSAGR